MSECVLEAGGERGKGGGGRGREGLSHIYYQECMNGGS